MKETIICTVCHKKVAKCENDVCVKCSANEHLYIDCDGLKVEVKIIGTRPMYGRAELEVTPVSGFNSRWVWKDKVTRLDPNLKAKVNG